MKKVLLSLLLCVGVTGCSVDDVSIDPVQELIELDTSTFKGIFLSNSELSLSKTDVSVVKTVLGDFDYAVRIPKGFFTLDDFLKGNSFYYTDVNNVKYGLLNRGGDWFSIEIQKDELVISQVTQDVYDYIKSRSTIKKQVVAPSVSIRYINLASSSDPLFGDSYSGEALIDVVGFDDDHVFYLTIRAPEGAIVEPRSPNAFITGNGTGHVTFSTFNLPIDLTVEDFRGTEYNFVIDQSIF